MRGTACSRNADGGGEVPLARGIPQRDPQAHSSDPLFGGGPDVSGLLPLASGF